MQKRGQVSIEFMFSIGVILLLYIIIVFFVFEKNSELRDTESFIDKRTQCFKIAEAVSAVYDSGSGTEASINLKYPIVIDGNLIQSTDIANVTTVKPKIAYVSYGVSRERTNLLSALQKKDPNYETYCTNISYVNYIRSIPGDYANAQLAGNGANGCPPYNGKPGDPGKPVNDLLNSLDSYNIIYIDDFHLLSQNYDKVFPKLDQWLQNDPNLLVFSEHIIHTNDYSLPLDPAIYKYNLFKVTYNTRGYNNGPQPPNFIPANGKLYYSYITHENDRYPDFRIDTQLFFKSYPYVNGSAIYVIAEYNQTQPPILNYGFATGKENVSIGYWQYGNGEINYISDFDETLFPDFQNKIINALTSAHYLLQIDQQKTVSCIGTVPVQSETPYFQDSLTIKNINNIIYLTE